MSERKDIEALRVLRTDSLLQELNDYVPSLSLMRVAGFARDEVAHSRILTELLDPRRHKGARTFLRATLRNLAAETNLDREKEAVVRTLVDASWLRARVHRELFLIDVVVEVASHLGNLVVGIENKIDAGEQELQLSRYQEALARSYPRHDAFMVFLTPEGRLPTTHDSRSSVAVVACGYEVILKAVRETSEQAIPGSHEERVLGELAAHLEEDILGEDEVRDLARELWRSHGRALQLALKHRPQLSDIRETYVSLLEERFGDDAHFAYYPESRSNLHEIKMSLSSWNDMGFPFTFILYVDSEKVPHVRALLWRDNYTAYAKSLTRWARRVNAGSRIIDEEFTPLGRGWGYWHRIFEEEDYPAEAALNDRAFDQNTAEAAVDAVTALVEQLRPYIETK